MHNCQYYTWIPVQIHISFHQAIWEISNSKRYWREISTHKIAVCRTVVSHSFADSLYNYSFKSMYIYWPLKFKAPWYLLFSSDIDKFIYMRKNCVLYVWWILKEYWVLALNWFLCVKNMTPFQENLANFTLFLQQNQRFHLLHSRQQVKY